MKKDLLLNSSGANPDLISRHLLPVGVSFASRLRVLGITMLCLLTFGVGNAWGDCSGSGLTASAGVFVLDFYDCSNLTSSSGSTFSETACESLTKVPSGILATNVITGVTNSGTVRYGMNGGLTLGTGSTGKSQTTIAIGADFPIRKITVVGTAYGSDGAPLVVAGTSVSTNAGQTAYASCSKSTTITPSPYITSIVIKQNTGSNKKRSTLYTAICEYGYRAYLTAPGTGSISAAPKTTNENGAGWNSTEGAVVGLKSTQQVTLTATPPSGYEVDAWTVKKKSDNTDVTASVLSGTTLTMPAYDVTVSVTWAAAASCDDDPTVTAASNNGSVSSTSIPVQCASGVSSIRDNCSWDNGSGSGAGASGGYGFVWAKSSDTTTPTVGGTNCSNYKIGNSIALNTAFNYTITGLQANTSYTIRPYAKNGHGYGYGTAYTVTTLQSYAITYNNNGGSGSMAADHKDHGVSFTLPSNAGDMTKEGHHIADWKLNSSSGTSYSLGGSYTTNSAATFYAGWAANTYTVTFDKNGGGTGTGTADQAFTYGVAQSLRSCGFTAPTADKYFAGWNTEPGGGGTSYTNGQSVSNLTTTHEGTVTLYAQWADHTYTNYKTLCCTDWDAPSLTGYSTSLTAGGSTTTISTGGATTYGAQTCLSSNMDVLTVTDAGVITPVGAGTATVTVTWAGNATYCEKSATTSTITVSGNLNVTFKKNGGSGTDDQTQSIPYNTATNLKTLSTLGITAPSCKEFYGWADSQSKADAGTRDYEDGEEVTILAGMTLYAVWKDITYAVSDGTMTGVGSHSYSSNPITCGTTLIITCAADGTHKGNPTVTASGTHGTITVVSATSVTIANVTSAITVNISYTAKENYTVTLNPGSGSLSATGSWSKSGDNLTQTVMEGTSVTALPSATPGCAGWSFVGWATSAADNADSDPTSYAAGATPEPTGNVTYYAVYRQSAPSGDNYDKITATGDLTTGKYMFVCTSNYAMKNVISGTHMDESSWGTYTGIGSTNECDNGDYIWTIIKFGSQVVIRNGSSYIGVNSSGDITFDANPHFFTYTYNTTEERWEFTSVTYTTQQLIYNLNFKIGTTQSTDICLFKQRETLSGNYYTTPPCAAYTVTGVPNPAAGGSVTLSAATGKSGDKVYAYYTVDEDYNFTSWEASGTGASVTPTDTRITELTVGSANATVTANFTAKVWRTVTWKANGVTLTGGDLGSASVKVENGHNITILPPTPTSCDDSGVGASDQFVGWVVNSENWGNKINDVSAKHIYKRASQFPTVTGDVTYHAVWAASDNTQNHWEKVTDIADVEAGFKYAIISFDDAYYLKNTDQSSAKPSVYAVTKTSGNINYTSDMEFTASEGSYGGFVFTSVAASGVKIWGSNNNDGVRVNSTGGTGTTSDEWYMVQDATYGAIMTAEDSKYLATYGTTDWRNYSSPNAGNRAANLHKYAYGYKQYMTLCCDKAITIAAPSKTGSGTVTFTEDSPYPTCLGETTDIHVNIAPTNGYQCTALAFSRADGGDIDIDPDISVPFTAATDFTLTVEQNANTTLNTTVTFVALIDHYIDNMHYNTTQNKSGNYGTAPTLTDETKGEQCTGLHYKFIGWIPETDMNMTTGVPTTTANMVAGGATGKYATGTNYYAIWAEEVTP